MMKSFFVLMTMACFSMTTTYAFAPNNQEQPIGYWQTIDDVTHKPKAIVHLYLEKNQTLSGKIVKLYENENSIIKKQCEACQGDKHNQPIVGLEILSGLKMQEDHSWSQGSILDPKNGKIYKCILTLKNQGNELQVRGYLGLPLLGRTQTWVRDKSLV